MLRNFSDSGNDGEVLEGYAMDDIDMSVLRSYRIKFLCTCAIKADGRTGWYL